MLLEHNIEPSIKKLVTAQPILRRSKKEMLLYHFSNFVFLGADSPLNLAIVPLLSSHENSAGSTIYTRKFLRLTLNPMKLTHI